MSKIKLGVFFSLILLIFFLNYQPITSFFSQDDFFHLNAIANKSLTEIPSFFVSLQKDYAFYRPLSRETYNLLMYQIFGLNPLPFHLINLTLIIAIGILVYLLAKKLSNLQWTAALSILIYFISSVHNVELYYLSSIQLLLSTFFIILSLLSYLNQRFINSTIFFILALTCHESSVILPGILFLAEMMILKRNVKRLIPFFLISAAYLLLTSLFSNLPGQSVYKPTFNVKNMINGLGWYIAWSFGLPEALVDFVGPKLNLNANFLKWYATYVKVIFPLIIFVFSSLIISLYMNWKKINKSILFFVGFSFLFSILPFLFFPQHKFIYYLELASVFFSITLALIFTSRNDFKITNILFILIFILSLLTVYKQTNDLNILTYWAAKRSVAAKYLLERVKNDYSHVSLSTIFYFKNDPNYPFIAKEWGNSSRQAFYILSGNDALQLLYKDQTIRAFYEDLGEIPQDIDNTKVKTVVARFPY